MAMFILAVAPPALAADPAAGFLTRLFITVCVQNLGQPAKVRQWADEHHLAPNEDPAALGLFVGPGGKGAAWAIRTEIGSFAFSIRGMTQACAVWAREANPDEATTNFRAIIEGVKRPGINVTIDRDRFAQSPVGRTHMLVYNVTKPNAPTSFEFTLLTAERTGGAFQVSMQAAKASAH